MRHLGFNITDARHNGFTVSSIYHLGQAVWQAARACFSRGWNNDLGWDNNAGWNND